MKVMALVGASGTGKSHKAMQVAYEHDIDYTIDDGLLIEGAKKLAGRSAKREKTRISAVKRALFHFSDHREEVASVIRDNPGKKILIIGTSDKMVDAIAEALALPKIEKRVYIHDISTPSEIETAKFFRRSHGKHVIPLPQMEIKKDFSGYFKDTISLIIGKKGERSGIDDTGVVRERTVIRPTFSYMGNYTISTKTLVQIVGRVARESEAVSKLSRVIVKSGEEGIYVTVHITAEHRMDMMRSVEKFQKNTISMLEHMTMLNVIGVDVLIQGIRHFQP